MLQSVTSRYLWPSEELLAVNFWLIIIKSYYCTKPVKCKIFWKKCSGARLTWNSNHCHLYYCTTAKHPKKRIFGRKLQLKWTLSIYYLLYNKKRLWPCSVFKCIYGIQYIARAGHATTCTATTTWPRVQVFSGQWISITFSRCRVVVVTKPTIVACPALYNV